MNSIIEIKHLYKNYGQVKAVNDLSFKVKKGELFAFLGVNGAGKSTTINIMTGNLSKSSGEILIAGKELNSNLFFIKKELGLVFQNSVLDKNLTVYENLKTRAALYNITGDSFLKRLDELSQFLNLKPILKRKIKQLSGGQRRRIDIARAILHKPSILILDEPTTGLDPMTRKMIWQSIDQLRQVENMTVFLTTHYMEEAAEADYVIVIDEGKKVAEGTPLELKTKYAGDFINLYHINEEEIKTLNLAYTKIRDGFKLEVKTTKEATDLILKYPHLFQDYEVMKGNMDDVFLSITGKTLEKEEENV